MKEEKITFFQMIIYLSLLGVLGVGFYLLAKTMILQTKKEAFQNNAVSISVQDVENVFKTCPIPFSEWELPERISSVCDNPTLEKQDFTVTPTSLYVVKNGEKLKLVEIKPSLPTAFSYLPESEAKPICFAFKELAKEIREKGGFAVAKCNENPPVLRIGVPEKNLPKKPEHSGSSGSGDSGISLFSLFSLVSIF